MTEISGSSRFIVRLAKPDSNKVRGGWRMIIWEPVTSPGVATTEGFHETELGPSA